jgi:hypothetical protein
MRLRRSIANAGIAPGKRWALLQKVLVFSLVVLFGTSLTAAAVMLDLTTVGASGEIQDAWFVQMDQQPTGTGVIDSFLRLRASPKEEGYNTSARPLELDELSSPIFTRDLLLGEVPIVTNPDGVGDSGDYYQFLLDINESSGGDNEFLTLHDLRIYVTVDPLSAPLPDSAAALDGALGPAAYAFNTALPDTIELDYSLNAGSGSGDMFAYIPVSLLGTDGEDYVTLYSAFGMPSTSSAGFEEWAVLQAETPPPQTTVPEPTATFLLGIGFVVFFGGYNWMAKRKGEKVIRN